MRTAWGIAGALVFAATLFSGCYAHTGMPPGPSCAQDPSQPGCLGPLQDDKKKPGAK